METHSYFLRKIWRQMHRRCYFAKDQRYSRYGARGIAVCEEWHDYSMFEEWALANGYARGLSIERKDNDGPYAPWNCRWATAKEQANNTASNHLLTLNGETHTIAEWANITGLGAGTIWKRLSLGWSPEETLTRSVRSSAIEYSGETHSLAEWSRITGLAENTISRRLQRGWPIEKALTKPSERYKK